MKVKLLPLLLFLSYPLQAMAPKAFVLARYNPKNTALMRYQRQGTMPQRMINSQKSIIPATIYNHWRDNNKNSFNTQQTYASYGTWIKNKFNNYLLCGSTLLGAMLLASADEDETKKKADEIIKLIQETPNMRAHWWAPCRETSGQYIRGEAPDHCIIQQKTENLLNKIEKFCQEPSSEQQLEAIVQELILKPKLLNAILVSMSWNSGPKGISVGPFDIACAQQMAVTIKSSGSINSECIEQNTEWSNICEKIFSRNQRQAKTILFDAFDSNLTYVMNNFDERTLSHYLIHAIGNKKKLNQKFLTFYEENFDQIELSGPFYKALEIPFYQGLELKGEATQRILLKKIASKLDANNQRHQRIIYYFLEKYQNELNYTHANIKSINYDPHSLTVMRDPRASHFLKPLAPHFKKYFLTYATTHPEYLWLIIYDNQSYIPEMGNLALQHFDEIGKHDTGKGFLMLLATCTEAEKECRTQLIIKLLQVPELREAALGYLFKNAPCDEQITSSPQIHALSDDIFTELAKKNYALRCVNQIASSSTLTEKHLFELEDRTNSDILDYETKKELRRLVNTFNKKQRELEENGYSTFVHGQQWPALQKEEWFTYLYGLKFNKPINDFLFLHIKQPIIDPAQLEEETKRRQHIIRNGRYGSGSDDREVRDRQLFLNHPFFGNNTRKGSSSACYIQNNDNVTLGGTYLKLSFEQVFKHFGYDYIYQKYARELQELENQFGDISQYGHALLIAVPKKNVDESVHLAKSPGKKKTINYRDKHGNEKKITTVSAALKKLDTKPAERFPTGTDEHEYCLAMTWDKLGGLNPDSGIKIFSINAADQEKLQAYRIKEQALRERIEADIRAEHDKQSGGLL